MSNNKGGYKSRLYVSVNSVVVVRTRPRAIPLARITIRKSIYVFPFLSYMGVGLHVELPLRARDFYRVIVDEGAALVNYHAIEISSS